MNYAEIIFRGSILHDELVATWMARLGILVI